jgi:ABC-type phosphate/phosphonate transport system ATPase subunit
VELARGWADRLVGMRRGQIILDGSPRDISEEALMGIYRGVVS